MDDRLLAWAELLVDYSMDVDAGDLLEITYAAEARPLALAVYRVALERGAHPVTSLSDDEFSRVLYEHASEDQLTHVPTHIEQKVAALDASLRIRAPQNTRELADADPNKMQVRSKARETLKERLIEETSWSLTQFPTRALAQEAGMAYETFQRFAYDACVKDWAEESEKYLPLKELVDAGSEVRIEGADTDLTFSIGTHDGITRVGTLSDGTHNVPGGEVFTAPRPDTVQGEITFELPAVTNGREVRGVHLVFEDGQVVEASAESGEDLLREQLDTDDGARRLGEFGIGTNFAIDRFTRNILFDEKIGGTVHLAVGKAYRDCLHRDVDLDAIDHRGLAADRIEDLVADARAALRDGRFDAFTADLDADAAAVAAAFRERWEALADAEDAQYNSSAVHWDFIKDLRDGGRFLIDDEVILEDGSFVAVETLP